MIHYHTLCHTHLLSCQQLSSLVKDRGGWGLMVSGHGLVSYLWVILMQLCVLTRYSTIKLKTERKGNHDVAGT